MKSQLGLGGFVPHRAAILPEVEFTKTKTKPGKPKKTRQRKLKECGPHKCCYCLRDIRGHTVTKEHVNPKSKGGGRVLPCCKPCNHFKGGDTLAEFKDRLIKILASVDSLLAETPPKDPAPRRKI